MNWVVTTIVVPSDGSAAAEAQLDSARTLAKATGARIVLVHIRELVRGHMGTHRLHLGEEVLEAGMRDQVNALRSEGLRIDLEIAASAGDPAAAIAKVAARNKADLIVTRMQRRSRVTALVFGGVTRRLVRIAPCPVLVLSPPPSRGRDRGLWASKSTLEQPAANPAIA